MVLKSNDLIAKTNLWLQKPITTSIEDSLHTSKSIIHQLQSLMQQQNIDKQLVGGLIGKVKGVEKAINSMEKINWLPIKNGYLSVGHRPSSKLAIDLKLQNATHILTLQSKQEGAEQTQSISTRNNLSWLFFPMETAKPIEQNRFNELVDLLSSMEQILNNKGKIYMHCSAGIHRTGMIGYCFLRFIGNDIKQSKNLLEKLRDITREGVGENRLDWVDSVIEEFTSLK